MIDPLPDAVPLREVTLEMLGGDPSKRYDANCRLTDPLRCNESIWDQMATVQADSTPKIEAALDKLIANGMPFAAASTSTVSTASPSTLTLDLLQAAVDAIPSEPIGEWMREQGFPPEKSLLLLPEALREHIPDRPPYVEFSAHVGMPALMRNPLAPEDPPPRPVQFRFDTLWGLPVIQPRDAVVKLAGEFGALGDAMRKGAAGLRRLGRVLKRPRGKQARRAAFAARQRQQRGGRA